MARVENLCVITSIILLIAGISTPYIPLNTGWSVIVGNTSFGLSWETPLYWLATLFCFFACVYSIRYIPFDTRLVQWHFWLSLGCVVWCIIGLVVFDVVVRGETEPRLGITGQALALSFVATLPIFLATQVLFAFALVRALIKMRLP
jgi:hypothetical protein